MSTHFKHVHDGPGPYTFGIRYTFDRVGDGLPRHKHEAWDAHLVQVVTGYIALIYDGMRAQTYGPNEVWGIHWDQDHEIIALNDGAQIANWYINGQPEHYKNLPPEELEGSFDVHDFRK